MQPAAVSSLCSPAWPVQADPPALRQYQEGSAPALAINATIEKTHTRFKNYGAQGLLCGADGLPHLIVDGNLQHLGEFTYPGLGFLYVAGWIGNVGRTYLNIVKQGAKPTEKEIIIDVPLALELAGKGAGWPLRVIDVRMDKSG